MNDALFLALEWKQKQARYFLDELKNHVATLDLKKTIRARPGPYLDSKPLYAERFFIAAHTDAFFYSVTSYLDILARYHTKKPKPKQKIYFQNWIDYQAPRNTADAYINFLKQEKTEWIEEVFRTRNEFAHRCHPVIHAHPVTVEKMGLSYRLMLMPMPFQGQLRPTHEICGYVDKRLDNLIAMVVRNRRKSFSYPSNQGV